MNRSYFVRGFTRIIDTANLDSESDLALDFASFLLRYHKDLDYRDFSDSKEVLARIRRAESYRSWADIEDLANNYESLGSNFENHKNTAA